MRCILGMLIWVWSLRDEYVGRHLAGYVDSDYAGDTAVLQSTIVLLTSEVEYMAMIEAI